ncbi:phospholipase A [Dysgonomonas sp.]|nr:phospholipase A [Prevotella sp.]
MNSNLHTSLSFRVSKNSNQYLTLDYYAGYGEGLLNYKKYTNQVRIGFTIKPDFFSAY